jgi:hypothetical protein
LRKFRQKPLPPHALRAALFRATRKLKAFKL